MDRVEGFGRRGYYIVIEAKEREGSQRKTHVVDQEEGLKGQKLATSKAKRTTLRSGWKTVVMCNIQQDLKSHSNKKESGPLSGRKGKSEKE